MLLAEVVRASEDVTATSSRSAKVARIAEVLRAAGPDAPNVAAFLTGKPRQGRIGVGWSTLAKVDVAPAAEPSLTVGDIDQLLVELQATTGAGSALGRSTRVAGAFALMTRPEQEFFLRLLTGGMRQGALDGVMTDAVAKAAGVPLAVVRRAAMLAGDLPRIAGVAMTEGEAGLVAIGLVVGAPVSPMLASTATGVGDALTATGPASVEWKLDGARVQAHRRDGEVSLYTRNLNDVTARMPGLVEVVRSLPGGDVILDGEVVGLAGDEDRPDAFQETISRFARQDGSSDSLAVRFFDCMHRDGDDLIDEPLTARLRVLDDVVGALAVPRIASDDEVEAAAFLEGALASGHEGVMVKALTSTYEAGRRGGSWRKVKPVKTLDLVVLAAEWGHGRRQGWLSNLHLGARGSNGFVMVGKTFKGLTDALLTWQTAELLARKVEEQGITVFVRPELVVEIALDGVQRSTRYPGGVALRFARVRGYRPDKAPDDADTIESVQALLHG